MAKKKKSNAGRKPYEDREELKETVRFSISKKVLKKWGKDNLLRPEVIEDNK